MFSKKRFENYSVKFANSKTVAISMNSVLEYKTQSKTFNEYYFELFKGTDR